MDSSLFSPTPSLQLNTYITITNHIYKTLLTFTVSQKLELNAVEIQRYFSPFLPLILKGIVSKFKDSRNEPLICSMLDFLIALCQHDVLIQCLLDAAPAEEIFSSLKLIFMSKSTQLQKKCINIILLLVKSYESNSRSSTSVKGDTFCTTIGSQASQNWSSSIRSLPFSIVRSDLDYFLVQTQSVYAQDLETTSKLVEIFVTLLNTSVLTEDRIEKLLEYSLRLRFFTITHKDLDRSTYLKLLKSSISSIKFLSYTIQSKLVSMINHLIHSTNITLDIKVAFSELLFQCTDHKLKGEVSLAISDLIRVLIKSENIGITQLKVFFNILQVESHESKLKIIHALEGNLMFVKNITKFMNYNGTHDNAKRAILTYGIMTELLKMEATVGAKMNFRDVKIKWSLRYILILLDCTSANVKYVHFIRTLVRNKFNFQLLEIRELKEGKAQEFFRCIQELVHKLLNLIVPTSGDEECLFEILSTLTEIIKFIQRSANLKHRESLLRNVLLGSSCQFALDFLLNYAEDLKDQNSLGFIIQFIGDWTGSIRKIKDTTGLKARSLRQFVIVSKRSRILRDRMYTSNLSMSSDSLTSF